MSSTGLPPARTVCLLTLIATLGWLPGAMPRANAAPYTPHFNELITLLGARAASIDETQDKAARKLESGIQKVLKTLNGKASTSLATDIKNLGKVAKSLKKLFPLELATVSGALPEALDEVVDGLEDNIESLVDSTESTLGGVGASSCKTKAGLTLGQAETFLATAQAATAGIDFVGAAKALKSALKAALKAKKAARSKKCAVPANGNEGNGNGNENGNTGGNDPAEFLRADITGSVTASFAALGSFETDATYDSFVDQLTVFGTDNAKLLSLLLAVRNVKGPDTYPVESGSSFLDLGKGTSYGIKVSGSVTFTALDFDKPELAGTFEVTYEQLLPPGTGSVTARRGRFRVLNINGRPGTAR